ncbi:rod shape-determining protein RodA [Phocoenobacter skyensis]|uniref:Peptidoglycan glycosyltransferase MrdB n=1 Tax=Phocoenobacter skyensis TaxID=97481 RepID=A0A1H7ZJK4_9PAST|nr:rod shape-determining protein RodA [Pasteurella skyensis]MDP8078946.1 rod shape-determining protein RodA [Pasteurella skyensis]MDP8084896.1 rod shape-determining protein RodA [Pasteurella skyensis]MDP8162882.1 rod shape-determining protein RodA [Pasteurella skyensis]MDP8169967.1 rod shape-determining protein RodA [Pasteurella skyensis]MDP8172531.1 rod shape-determining protein RodA [Pasteurella skyensis]
MSKQFVTYIKKILDMDIWLLLGLFVITSYGLWVLYSASGANERMFTNRIIQVTLGFGVLFFMALLPPLFYQKISPLLYCVCLILLVLVDVTGEVSKGAQRWLNLGFVRFQPSEIAKLAVPLMVASYLGKRALPPSLKDTAIVLLIIIVPTLLVAIQPDLGTSLLVFAAGMFVLFLAGLSWKLIGSGILALAAFIPVMWFYLMHDYQKRRVMTLLDPEREPLGAGYHIIQSKIAIGSGGFYGKGWLEGTQSQLEFLPEPHTDFIFAVLGEEQGMVGVLILLAIYLFIIARGLIIGVKASSAFGRFISGGTALLFFVYVFVNIGMVSGILPVVGVPLPLFSYGGTSFVTLMAAFGLVMSTYVHQAKQKDTNPYNRKFTGKQRTI